MPATTWKVRRAVQLGALLLLLGLLPVCAREPEVLVEVPPRMQLASWPRIGIIEFGGGAEPELAQLATQSFVEMLHSSQGGLRILEIGSESRLLAQVGRPELDFEAVHAIAERFQLDAVFAGELVVGKAKPSVLLGDAFDSVTARADVSAQLEARMLEGASGATLWSRSSANSVPVAHFGTARGVGPSFGIGDPRDAYPELVRGLVSQLQNDFLPSWRRP